MEDLIKAWKDSGINPSYHMKVKGRLEREWSSLSKAITKLIESYDRGTLIQGLGECNHKWIVATWSSRDTGGLSSIGYAPYGSVTKATEVICTKCLILKGIEE